MKIAYIIPSLANKGPILVVRDLCVELLKIGHFCDVYYFDEIIKLIIKYLKGSKSMLLGLF